MSCCGSKRKLTPREVFTAIGRGDVDFVRRSLKHIINMVDVSGSLIRQHKFQITELSICPCGGELGEGDCGIVPASAAGLASGVVNPSNSSGDYMNETQPFAGCTPLMYAASLGNYEICSLLRHQVGYRAASGEGALFFAAARGYERIARLLLDCCEQEVLFTSRAKNITCLMAAAEAGHVDIVRLVVSRFLHLDANSLALSGSKAREAVLEAAKKNGLQLQVTENTSQSGPVDPDALFSSLSKAQILATEAQLLTQKTTDDGFTALMLAVAGPNPSVEVTEILAPYEATLYTAPHYTALMLCIDTHTDVMMQILEERTSRDPLIAKAARESTVPETIMKIVQILIDHDECKRDNSDGLTALMIACQVGNTPIARLLLPHEATLCRRSDGLTPLMVAANAGNEEIVKMLIDDYADELCGKTDTSGWTALTGAVHSVSQLYRSSLAADYSSDGANNNNNSSNNDREAAISPGAGQNSNNNNNNNNNSNTNSVTTNNLGIGDPVQRNSADRAQKGQFGIYSRRYMNVVKMLIPYEAGVCRRDGSTGLMLAAETGYAELAALLVEKESGKYNINSVTSLMLAAVHNRVEVAKVILRNELRKLEKAGYSVLEVKGIPDFLESCGEVVDYSGIQQPNKYKCILDLIGSSKPGLQLEIGKADKNDLNAIMLAIIHNHEKFALMLAPFEAGTVRTNGLTSTILAIKREMTELTLDLIERDNLEIANESGITALILASNLGMTEVVRKMASMGEKGGIGKTNTYGKTALIIATMGKKVDIVEILAPYEIDIKDNANLNALDYAKKLHCAANDEVCQRMITVLTKAMRSGH